MLERVRITVSRECVQAEFPTLELIEHGEVDLVQAASEWRRPDFDWYAFDAAVDGLEQRPSAMRISEDDAAPAAVEILSRAQRAIGRRNAHSSGAEFDELLRRHRELHNLTKPLVRADYNHSRDVWQWLLRLDSSAELPVQIAALFHDIERLVNEADARVEQNAADYQSFKDAHARKGAEMTRPILSETGFPREVSDRACELIAVHERPSADPDLQLLNDADGLSFFSHNSNGFLDYFGPEHTRRKVQFTLARMSEPARARLADVGMRPEIRVILRCVGGSG